MIEIGIQSLIVDLIIWTVKGYKPKREKLVKPANLNLLYEIPISIIEYCGDMTRMKRRHAMKKKPMHLLLVLADIIWRSSCAVELFFLFIFHPIINIPSYDIYNS